MSARSRGRQPAAASRSDCGASTSVLQSLSAPLSAATPSWAVAVGAPVSFPATSTLSLCALRHRCAWAPAPPTTPERNSGPRPGASLASLFVVRARPCTRVGVASAQATVSHRGAVPPSKRACEAEAPLPAQTLLAHLRAHSPAAAHAETVASATAIHAVTAERSAKRRPRAPRRFRGTTLRAPERTARETLDFSSPAAHL